jgi:hypothetical protein
MIRKDLKTFQAFGERSEEPTMRVDPYLNVTYLGRIEVLTPKFVRKSALFGNW